jgi:hypothetical protein
MLQIQTLDLGLLTIVLANIDITCACAITAMAEIGIMRIVTGSNPHSTSRAQQLAGIYIRHDGELAKKMQMTGGTCNIASQLPPAVHKQNLASVSLQNTRPYVH